MVEDIQSRPQRDKEVTVSVIQSINVKEDSTKKWNSGLSGKMNGKESSRG